MPIYFTRPIEGEAKEHYLPHIVKRPINLMDIETFAAQLLQLSGQASSKLRIAGLTEVFKKLSPGELSSALFMLEPRNKTLTKLDLSTQRLALVVPRRDSMRLCASWLLQAPVHPDRRSLVTFVQSVEALVPAKGQTVASRLSRVATFLSQCSRASGWLLVAALTDELTIGLGRQNVIRGLSHALDIPLDTLRHACSASQDLFRVDFSDLKGLSPLVSFRPMLASVYKQPADGQFLWQKKQDGFRVLIHWTPDKVKVFSRGQQDVTLTTEGLINRHLHFDRDTILDGQIIHRDGFQQVTKIIRRKSKFQQFLEGLRLVIFDVVYFGTPVLDRPYRERRALLQQLVPALLPPSGPFRPQDAAAVVHQATQQGWEGVMVKDLAAPYTLGRRTKSWYKLKGEFRELDVAVLGYEEAEGHKSGVGSFILGIRHGPSLETIGKVGTGFTDDARRVLLQALSTPEPTCTVKFQSISVSPRTQSGYALRFPVFVRMRDDKCWSQIATYQQVQQWASEQRHSP